MRPLELTWSGILATAAVFVVIVVCVRLGLWQLDRHEQRALRNAAIAARLDEPLVTLRSPPRDTAGLSYRRAVVEGTYDNARAVVLAGRSHAGAPGVHVLAPLRTGDGALLVNRGWLPAPDAATVDLDAVAADTPVTVTGMLLPFPDVDLERPEDDGFRKTWFRLDGDALREQYPYAVAPLYLVADHGGAGREARPAPLPVAPPSLGAGPHLSYALQWFGFAIVFLVGWTALVVRRGREERPASRSGAGTTG